MRKFFLQLLLGNLASKLLLIGADALAFLGLPNDAFGAFALVQALILSGAVISVWGSDQALINVIGRAHRGHYDLASYIVLMRLRVAIASMLVSACLVTIAIGSSVSFSPKILLVVGVVAIIEAQLVVNAAIFRAHSRPYIAVFLFDGMRNLSLFAGALSLYVTGGGFETLLYFWLAAAMFSFVVGTFSACRLLRGSGSTPIPENDHKHAAEISRFSGLWSVVQSIISRLVLIVSAYLLSPDDLGVVAFFLKLMVVFTFLQTVVIQASAPFIGRISQVANRVTARRIYRLTTVFLAAATTPVIAACLLAMDRVKEAFSIYYDGIELAVTALLFAQALNIGTGIIGQFIVHFGHARALLIISAVGAAIQCLLLLILGVQYGVAGVLVSYALASVLLVILRNALGAIKIGIHGFGYANLLIMSIIAIEVLLVQAFSIATRVGTLWLLISHALFSAVVVMIGVTRSSEAVAWLKSSEARDA